jgi:hypothetical protein
VSNARIKPTLLKTLNEALSEAVIEKQKRISYKSEAAALRAKFADFIYSRSEVVPT